MKGNPKNFSVKIISGNAYIYSWHYRKKEFRRSISTQRFHWKYLGKYGSRRVNEFMKTLNEEEINELINQVKKKLNNWEQLQKERLKILSIEPYKSRLKDIENIRNRFTREKNMKVLNQEIKQLLKKKTNMD